jgi:heterotetrameric sarcosine oxidase gamma subunit
MTDQIIERSSALNSMASKKVSNDNVIIEEINNLTLHQIAAWPDTLAEVKEKVQKLTNTKGVIKPAVIVTGNDLSVFWIDPLKFWVLGTHNPTLKADIGTTLDLSHSYVHLRLSGTNVVTLLNKHLPLDLREQSFPNNSTAASAIHHIQIRLWRENDGYHLLLQRGFAQSIYEMLT